MGAQIPPSMSLLLPSAPFILYLVALAGILSDRLSRSVTAVAWATGCALHAWLLFDPAVPGASFVFTFFNAMALTALLINALVLAWAMFQPTWHLGLITLPGALAAIWIEPATGSQAIALPWSVNAHIMISLLAYGTLMLAGAQALMLLLKEHQLNSRHLADHISSRLPPLDRMESLLIKIIALGLILLSVGLAIGGNAMTEPFSPGMMHKIVFSVLAWITLVALLWGHWQFGWRGRLAAGMTLAGLVFLILGFLGTKLVLEIILNRPIQPG